jgi:hypothetical protein
MLSSNELGNLSDRDLLAESRAYQLKLANNPAGLNMTSDEATALKTLNTNFENALNAWDEVQFEYDARRQTKDAERKTLLSELRRQRNVAYADVNNSDEALAGYGLPPRDKVKTASAQPSSAPAGHIEYGKLQHTIHFRDAATPESDSKAKPKGILGCEIWRFKGTGAPASEDDLEYVATDTASPYVASYEMADAGKKVSYLLRWISKSGARGEWSETVEATVNG